VDFRRSEKGRDRHLHSLAQNGGKQKKYRYPRKKMEGRGNHKPAKVVGRARLSLQVRGRGTKGPELEPCTSKDRGGVRIRHLELKYKRERRGKGSVRSYRRRFFHLKKREGNGKPSWLNVPDDARRREGDSPPRGRLLLIRKI